MMPPFFKTPLGAFFQRVFGVDPDPFNSQVAGHQPWPVLKLPKLGEGVGPGSYVSLNDGPPSWRPRYGKVLVKQGPPGIVRVRWSDGSQSFAEAATLLRCAYRPIQRVEQTIQFCTAAAVHPGASELVTIDPLRFRLRLDSVTTWVGTYIEDVQIHESAGHSSVTITSLGPAPPATGMRDRPRVFKGPETVRGSAWIALRLRNITSVPLLLCAYLSGHRLESP